MCLWVDLIGEQFNHAVAAKFIRRQADVVDHQQTDFRTRRAFVAIGRSDKFGGIQQTGSINAHDRMNR
ncbi:hypothetical protein SAMN05216333_11381 [Nitrosomonas oligotropha]|uniref:Uncharacterized protein n=1 Tax=Nitrosomonas oligotropha TaxID=42354 RepID=A0A1H8R809_9PROT|nr:hypothetical protein SAMN05216300_11180 [Nitrosomonas oligotropha]SEO62486.1 hypothetical protein SAMN05216333_11381 [Nitrosomonas oligotropha]